MSGTTRDRLTPVDDTVDYPVFHDNSQGTYHAWCDASDYEPVSTGVVRAVASVHGVDPIDLEPLADRIDPDALNRLVVEWAESDGQHDGGSISFPFARCTVTVRGSGEIVIESDPTDDRAR